MARSRVSLANSEREREREREGLINSLTSSIGYSTIIIRDAKFDLPRQMINQTKQVGRFYLKDLFSTGKPQCSSNMKSIPGTVKYNYESLFKFIFCSLD
jgi:hypothetical protein